MLSTNVIASNDIIFSILQWIPDLKMLRLMSLTCHSLNSALCDTKLGRKLWMEIGESLTSVGDDGFNVDDIKGCFAGIDERGAFFSLLRQLVCPWTVFPLQIPLHINVLSRDHLLLLRDYIIYHLEDGKKVKAAFSSNPYAIDLTVEDAVHAAAFCVSEKVPFMSRKIQEISSTAALKKIVPDFSHDRGCEYCVFPVHAGVFAVSEVFSRLFDNGPELFDHGIYFFSHLDGRMLRHINFTGFQTIRFGCLVSRPTELWLLTMDGVDYFGPVCPSRIQMAQHHAELMDPALWRIGRGDHAGAIAHMQSIGAPLETGSLISGRTLLHYAAKEGHSEAVGALLEAGFKDVDAVDHYNHTALYMATAELRVEVVEVLLKRARAKVDAGEYIFGCIGEFVQYRPYARSISYARSEIDLFVPNIVRLLLGAKQGVLIPDDDTICNPSVLSCPDAVRMLCSSGEMVSMDLVAFSFSEFRTREHALSAIGSLCVLVREFGLDINAQNTRNGVLREYPLLYLAQYSIAESVMAAVDFFGADPRVVGLNKHTLRWVVERRLHNSNGGDDDARRIVEFLDSRCL